MSGSNSGAAGLETLPLLKCQSRTCHVHISRIVLHVVDILASTRKGSLSVRMSIFRHMEGDRDTSTLQEAKWSQVSCHFDQVTILPKLWIFSMECPWEKSFVHYRTHIICLGLSSKFCKFVSIWPRIVRWSINIHYKAISHAQSQI